MDGFERETGQNLWDFHLRDKYENEDMMRVILSERQTMMSV